MLILGAGGNAIFLFLSFSTDHPVIGLGLGKRHRDFVRMEDDGLMIGIWEERKVFGSRGQILKEEFVKNQPNNDNKNGKHVGFKMKPIARNTLDKIVSGYQVVYCGQLDEDAVLNNCSNAISSIEKIKKDIGKDYRTGCTGTHGNQQAVDGKGDAPSLAEQSRQETQTIQMSHNFMSRSREQSAPIMYTWQVPFTEKSCQIEEHPKPAAAKLTASTSSAEMLSYVLSSLASEGLVSNQIKELSDDYSLEKRAKTENDHVSYVLQNPQAPVPHLYHASIQHALLVPSQESNPDHSPPPPPSSPPPLPPLPPMQPYPIPQYMPTADLVPNVPYSYNTSQHPAPLPSYPPFWPPMNGISTLGFHPPNAYQMYPTVSGLYEPTPDIGQ